MRAYRVGMEMPPTFSMTSGFPRVGFEGYHSGSTDTDLKVAWFAQETAERQHKAKEPLVSPMLAPSPPKPQLPPPLPQERQTDRPPQVPLRHEQRPQQDTQKFSYASPTPPPALTVSRAEVQLLAAFGKGDVPTRRAPADGYGVCGDHPTARGAYGAPPTARGAYDATGQPVQPLGQRAADAIPPAALDCCARPLVAKPCDPQSASEGHYEEAGSLTPPMPSAPVGDPAAATMSFDQYPPDRTPSPSTGRTPSPGTSRSPSPGTGRSPPPRSGATAAPHATAAELRQLRRRSPDGRSRSDGKGSRKALSLEPIPERCPLMAGVAADLPRHRGSPSRADEHGRNRGQRSGKSHGCPDARPPLAPGAAPAYPMKVPSARDRFQVKKGAPEPNFSRTSSTSSSPGTKMRTARKTIAHCTSTESEQNSSRGSLHELRRSRSAGALPIAAVMEAAGGGRENWENGAGAQQGACGTNGAASSGRNSTSCKWELMQADLDATVEEPAGLWGRLLKTSPFYSAENA